MTDYSRIWITTHHNSVRNAIEGYTYEWKGKSPLVMISYHLLDQADPKLLKRLPNDMLQIGPYKLKKVETDFSHGYPDEIYVRVDYPLWRLVVIANKFGKVLRIVKARFILTLAVWGLADYNPAVYPSFRDIKVIRNWRGHGV